MQINSVPLLLINFHKFITGDEKWTLYSNSERRKRGLIIDQPSTSKPNTQKKVLVCKDKGIELICTPNDKNGVI